MDILATARILAADRCCNEFLFEARALWVGVAMDQTHDVRLIAGLHAAHMKSNRLPRRDTEPIGITNNFHASLL